MTHDCKYEEYKSKFELLHDSLLNEIVGIIDKNGGCVEFAETDLFKYTRQGCDYEITRADIASKCEECKVMLTRTSPEIMFNVDSIKDELNFNQTLDFLNYLESNWMVAENDKEKAAIELLQYIWNDKDLKNMCSSEDMLHDIAANVVEDFKENMEAYLLDKCYIDIAWYEVCSDTKRKYIINLDEVYALFKDYSYSQSGSFK